MEENINRIIFPLNPIFILLPNINQIFGNLNQCLIILIRILTVPLLMLCCFYSIFNSQILIFKFRLNLISFIEKIYFYYLS